MAALSRHPVAPPPGPPERATTRHLLLRAYCIFLLFLALATTFWFNLLGIVGLAILFGITVVVTLIIWGVARPQVDWRRLPWFAIGYMVWAAASIIWSSWRDATALTWALMAITTLQGLFVAASLTWRGLVRAIASALKWIMGLSIVFELWVSLVVRAPILPNFLLWNGPLETELYWSRNNLFDGGRIQGIVGNAHLLAIAALVAIIVFAVRIASGAPRRGWLYAWIALSAFLLWRANSATVLLTGVAVLVVLTTVLLMRRTTRPGERTRYYLAYAGVAIVGAATLWFLREPLLGMLGKTGDFTGRTEIWNAVLARAAEHPVVGSGFSTPWLPWVPEFDHWIVVNGLTVFHAHNMWLDVLMQLGIIGVVLMALVMFSVTWRSWFFAVDRPRFDLRADRPYTAVTLLPTLLVTVLLVQGLAESRPLMEWGWMFIVLLGFKLKQSPLVDIGPREEGGSHESQAERLRDERRIFARRAARHAARDNAEGKQSARDAATQRSTAAGA